MNHFFRKTNIFKTMKQIYEDKLLSHFVESDIEAIWSLMKTLGDAYPMPESELASIHNDKKTMANESASASDDLKTDKPKESKEHEENEYFSKEMRRRSTRKSQILNELPTICE